jgi:putative hydrolase of the HAD superfamily
MNVVFDFGAVLFTWRPAELVAQCFPEAAATPQQAGQLAHAVFGHPDWHDFDRGTLPLAEVVARTAQRLDLNPAVLTELVESIGERLVPIPETVALLAQLHAQRASSASGARLYFLSNMPVPYARTLERLHPFLQWFDGGIFSGDVHHIKPEPAIYTLLQTRYALYPAQTVFIDDLLGNVQAARTLGWHGIHFESAAQVEAQLQALNLSK